MIRERSGWVLCYYWLITYMRSMLDCQRIKKRKKWFLRKGRISFEKEMVENSWIDRLWKQGQVGSCKFLKIWSCKAPNNWEIVLFSMIQSCKGSND